jgi:hypothetical protein
MKLKLETELQITESNAAELREMLRKFDEQQQAMKPMPIRERWANCTPVKFRDPGGAPDGFSVRTSAGRALIIANATDTDGDEKRILATAQLANACKLAGGEWMKLTGGRRWVIDIGHRKTWYVAEEDGGLFVLMAFKTKEQAESVSSAPDFSELMAIAFPITKIK